MTEGIPKLFFKSETDDFDSEMKGYRNDVFVILDDGSIYEVFFYDMVRLKQDMGNGIFISQPGLIILETVNKLSIESAVVNLWKRGFFNYFIPRSSLDEKHFEENI
jgi:hypothetical protein